ncbi:MAG: YaiI/YqxD family protein [Pseudomonadota bacterium]
MPTIYIDADACPVKAETLKVAARYGLHTFIVSNGGMRPSRDPLVTTITVPDGPDVADDWIAERARDGDIVITADIPLAARVLERKAHALGPNGRLFTKDTIGMALAMRQLKQDIREATQTQTRHAPFSARDRSQFLQALDQIASKVTRP